MQTIFRETIVYGVIIPVAITASEQIISGLTLLLKCGYTFMSRNKQSRK